MENSIVEFNEFEAKLQEFKSDFVGVVYDLTDPEQDKQARSDRLTIGKVVSALDSKHKELKAPLKEKTDLIDSERKRIKDDLLSVQDGIKAQIKARDDEIAAQAEALQFKVDFFPTLAQFDPLTTPTAAMVADRLEKAKAVNVDDSYEHRKADATLAQVEAIKTLEALHAECVKREQEQAELAKLQREKAEREQAEHEEKIRKEAADRATKEAEAKAAREREAEKQAQREAEEKAERERQAIREKTANIEYRANIHSAAKQAFIDNGVNEKEAVRLVKLIRDGAIDNVVINY